MQPNGAIDNDLIRNWLGLETITAHYDGTIDTTLGKPHLMPGHTPGPEVHAALAHAPILITTPDIVMRALQPDGYPWADTITTCTPDGILRITTPTTTYVYELHRARLVNDMLHPNLLSHCRISEGWYIARWVD
jgi:hypothetical protein